MSAAPNPVPPAPSQKPEVRPNFFKALRGVWLFTWKSQLAWRRWPGLLFGLCFLPFLIYITTFSQKSWDRRHPWIGNPIESIDSITYRIRGAGRELTREQKTQVLQIFREEYARGERDWRAATDATRGSQKDKVREIHENIRERVRTIVDDQQSSSFFSYEQRLMDNNLARVREPRSGRQEPFYRWLIDFYFIIILPLSCIGACGALIRDELQADTLVFLTIRPHSRDQLLVMKYLSQTAWLQITLGITTLLIFAAGALRQVPDLASVMPVFLAAQILAVFAWSALGTLLGMITKRYLPLGVVYGLVMELGIGRIPTNINTLSLTKHLKSILGQNSTLQSIYAWPVETGLLPATALVLAAAIFLVLAALLFTFREYHHAAEMQN